MWKDGNCWNIHAIKHRVERRLSLLCISHTFPQKAPYRRYNSPLRTFLVTHTLRIFNNTNSSAIAMGIHGRLIAQYEHKLAHSDIQRILPIGVIRCAAAKASPIENLQWVTFSPSGCLKKPNWYNVHAQCCEIIKARGMAIRSYKPYSRWPLFYKMLFSLSYFMKLLFRKNDSDLLAISSGWVLVWRIWLLATIMRVYNCMARF